MLGHSVGPSLHTGPAVMAIATAAAHPDWHCPDDIDVPLLQLSLSLSINEASFQHLLSTAPSIRCRALALSSSQPHAGDWLNVLPSSSLGLHLQDHELKCCLQYWLGVHFTAAHSPAQNATALLTYSGTTKSAVVAMETAFLTTTHPRCYFLRSSVSCAGTLQGITWPST